MLRIFLILTGILSLFQISAASASAISEPVETGHAVTRLVSEKSGIAPGETIRLGIAQELQDHWHVYWQNPGDSGLRLDLRWTLPDGFEAGEILYPVPHRIPLGPLVNFGHEGAPVFLVDLTAPADAIPGTETEIAVSASWLICDDICVPEMADLSITLPVVASPASEDLQGGMIIRKAEKSLPVDAPFDVSWFTITGTNGKTGPALLLPEEVEAADAEFFPYQPGLIEPAGAEEILVTGAGAAIAYTPSFEFDATAQTPLAGILAIEENGQRTGYRISATRIEAPAVTGPVTDSADKTPSPAPAQGLLALLGGALLGGLILNIMPCVFPIVFLKAANLTQSAHEDRGTMIRHGLLYTAGILVMFLALAGLLLALRAGGEQLGWGFHLQSPVVVSVFAFVIMAVGLNLAGVFELGTSVQGLGSGLAEKGGNAGAFFTGLLAVAVAAPCIGPFLGVPIGVALSQSAPMALAIFALIGLGLALPYLLISVIPGLARLLPRPGPWMEIFKQLMSFAMFATVIWLVWTVTMQTGTGGLVRILTGLLFIGFAAWAWGRAQRASGGWAIIGWLLVLAALAGAFFTVHRLAPVEKTATANAEQESVPYSEEKLAELRAAGTPVFIDFTAAWCVTCQVNKIQVLSKPDIIALFQEKGVILMVADWTNPDPEITKALEAQGRSGVPLYLYYAPGAAEPQVLPQLLSKEIIRETFSGL